MTYAADQLVAEVAYLGERLHWSMDDLLDLEHNDRHRFLEIVGSGDVVHRTSGRNG